VSSNIDETLWRFLFQVSANFKLRNQRMASEKVYPIQFARQFDNKVRRVKKNDVWFFSILDMFEHYGQSSNPTVDWQRTKDKLDVQGFDVLTNVLEHQFVRQDGKLNRPTPIVSFNTILRIAQVTNFKNWEYLRQRMADIAEQQIMQGEPILDASEQDPEIRDEGKENRKYLASAVDETIYDLFPRKKLGQHIAALTNLTYEHLLGAFKGELAKRYNFTNTQTKKFRDQFGNITLSALNYIEKTAAYEMYAHGRKLSDFEQRKIVDQIARDMADIFHRQCERMKVDWLTNKPLLPQSNDVA
jgi:hypothetical protein